MKTEYQANQALANAATERAEWARKLAPMQRRATLRKGKRAPIELGILLGMVAVMAALFMLAMHGVITPMGV